MIKIILTLLVFLSAASLYSGNSGEHPADFTLTYYMRDTVSGSNLIMEIKKEKLEIDYVNGVRKISKRKFYELEDEEIDKIYTYMADEKFMERDSPEKTITQNSAAQYIAGSYNGKENVLIFSAAGDPPLFLLKLKHKLFDLANNYDKFWKRDMSDVFKIEGYEEK